MSPLFSPLTDREQIPELDLLPDLEMPQVKLRCSSGLARRRVACGEGLSETPPLLSV